MSKAVLPTTDLYFANACRSWISRWWRSGPVQRIGANCFVSGDRLLVIRRDTPELIERALRWPGQLIYLIDDDIDGAAQSPGLPPSYRDRLAAFARGDYDRLLRRADRIVVSAVSLAGQLARDARVSAKLDVLDPFWRSPFPEAAGLASNGDLGSDVVHLGSGSHSSGLRLATPAILAMLEDSAQTRFTYVAKRGSHAALEAHPRTLRISPMAWPRYCRWLPRQRFDLGLYPLSREPFDRARSVNKIIEHGLVGAVGVYPADWAPAAALGKAVLVAPPDPADWTATLIEAVSDPSALAQRRAAVPTVLGGYADPERQRRFWAEVFGWQ